METVPELVRQLYYQPEPAARPEVLLKLSSRQPFGLTASAPTR
jgi:hypothetical protein